MSDRDLYFQNPKRWDKLTIDEKTACLNHLIDEARAHWDNVYENGCSDPSWPDGTNLNLIRNHIIHYMNELNRLNEQTIQLTMFSTFEERAVDLETDPRMPPIVPNDYMARERYCNYFVGRN